MKSLPTNLLLSTSYIPMHPCSDEWGILQKCNLFLAGSFFQTRETLVRASTVLSILFSQSQKSRIRTKYFEGWRNRIKLSGFKKERETKDSLCIHSLCIPTEDVLSLSSLKKLKRFVSHTRAVSWLSLWDYLLLLVTFWGKPWRSVVTALDLKISSFNPRSPTK